MCLQCLFARQILLCMLCLPLRRSSIMNPFVIQHARNMTDLPVAFTATQDHIVALRTIILTMKASVRQHKLSPCHKQMGNIIICTQQVDIEFRFESRFQIMTSIFCHPVFIGINHIIAFSLQSIHHPVQGILRQDIVMIQQCNIRSFCRLQCPVTVPGNSKIFFHFYVLDSRFILHILPDNALRLQTIHLLQHRQFAIL